MKKKLILIFLIMATCLVPQAFSAPWAPWYTLLGVIQRTANENKSFGYGKEYSIQDIINKIDDCGIEQLLEVDADGWNSLDYLVVMDGTETAIKKLLMKSKSLSSWDRDRFINNPLDCYSNTPLLYSLTANKDSISKLLIEYGADINRNYRCGDGTEVSALWLAITHNNPDTAELLVKIGADRIKPCDIESWKKMRKNK